MASDIKQDASSCLNDPNFAIICAFLTKFASKLNVTYPNFQDMQKMLEDTEDVAEDLKNLIIKLLRKNRKTVHLDKWEHALSKFCYGYSAQDAWEIERFGYKKASLTVKLRVLKEIMESQFERNLKFKSDVNLVSADELRSQPLGKDKLGNSYWSMTDENLNLRIYQEHLDEDIWKVVANSREELVQLIECLKGNAMKMPSLVGLVDEDSSSNSMPAPPKIDALRDVTTVPETEKNTELVPTNVATTEKTEELKKINETAQCHTTVKKSPPVLLKAPTAIVGGEEDESEEEEEAEEETEEEDDESNISEIDESSQAASDAASVITNVSKSNEADEAKRPSLLASKPPSNKDDNQTTMTSKSKSTSETKIVITKRPAVEDSGGEEGPAKLPKLQRPMLLNNTQQSLKTNKYANLKQVKSSSTVEDDDDEDDESSWTEDEEEEEEENEEKTTVGGAQNEEDETDDEEIDDDDEVGDEIEEPVMYVKGEGSGKDSKGIPSDLIDSDEPFECSESIVEAVFYVHGEGSGTECMVGNTKNDNATGSTTTEAPPAEKPPMFFFGQPGCLKLSPIKVASPGDIKPEKLKSNLFAEDVKDEACVDKSKDEEFESTIGNCDESKIELSPSNTEAECNSVICDQSGSNKPAVEAEIQNDISIVTNNDSSINEADDVTKSCVSPSTNHSIQNDFKEDIVQESLQNNKPATEDILQIQNHSEVLSENSEKSSEDRPKLQEDAPALKDSDVTAAPTENIPLMNESPSNACELVQQDEILESSGTIPLPVEFEASSIKESIEEQLLVEDDLIKSPNLKNIESEVTKCDDSEQGIIEPLATPVQIIEENSAPRVQTILTETPNKEPMEPPDPIVKSESVALETKPEETPISIELKQESTLVPEKIVEVEMKKAELEHAIPQTPNKVETPFPVINVLQTVQETPKKLTLTEYSDSSSDSVANADTPEDLVSKQMQLADDRKSKSPIPVIKVTDAPQSEIEMAASSIETNKLQPPNDVNHKDIPFPQSPPSPPLQSFSKPDTPPIPTTIDSSPANLSLSKEPAILPSISNKHSETIEKDVVQIKVTELVQPLKTSSLELIRTVKHLSPEPSEALQEPEVILKSEAEPVLPVSVQEVIAEKAAIPVVETKELSTPVEHIPEAMIEKAKDPVTPSEENLVKSADVTPPLVTPSKNSLIPPVISVTTATQVPSNEVIVATPTPQSTTNTTATAKPLSLSTSDALPNYRKRRINLPKGRLSSESSDASNGQMPSEEEYVAEKRPKMRAKCPQLSARKNAEQKRSVKQAEWSSDEDDMTRQLQSKKKLENESPVTVDTKTTIITTRPGPKSKKSIVENHVTVESSTPIEKCKNEQLPANASSVQPETKLGDSNEIDTEPVVANVKLLVENPTIKTKPGPKSKKQLVTEEKIVDSKVDEVPPTKIESLPNKKRGMDTRNSPKPAATVSPTIIKPTTTPNASEPITLPIANTEVLKKKPVPKPKPKPLTKKEKEKAKQIANKLKKTENKAKADKEKLRKQNQSSSNEDDEEEMDDVPLKPAAKSTTIQPASVVKPETPAKKVSATKKKKIMGLDVDEDVILQLADGETPVRQSRRIAQIKIKEEAERRDMEEIALKKLKADADRKKKGGIGSINEEAQATTTSQHSKSSKEKSDSDASVCTEPKPEVKKKKKKLRTGNPWQTDSDRDISDADEEEEIYDKHYESDHRIVFMKSDHEFSCESDVEEGAAVLPVKRARTALKTDEPFIEDDGYACQKCNKHDHPEWILLCDTCDKGYHCSCLVPLLFLIPEGDWFCPPCQQVQLIASLESHLLSFDTVQKERELEEEKRQQAIIASINEANVLSPDKPNEKQRSSAKERRKRRNQTRRRVSESELSEVSGSSKSSRSSNSSSNSSDNEPIYKLRKRKQTVISYRFNEYDDLINTAIKREMDAAEGAAANLSRGKQVEGVHDLKPEGKGKEMPESDKTAEFKVQTVKKGGKGKVMQGESDSENSVAPVKKAVRSGKHLPGEEDSEDEEEDELKKENDGSEKESSESEPIKPKILSKPNKKKKKKLNSLDIDSEDDGSDDDFRTSSFSEDEEEDEQFSASGSDSSLDMYTKKKNRKRDTRRSVRARRKRIDTDFINDSDEDDLPLIVTRKKKKKEESDSEFNENESTEEEAEDVDSDDLCDDDSDSGSDGAWQSKKKSAKAKKPNRPPILPTPASAASKALANRKKVKRKEDLTFRAGISVKSKGKEPASTSNNGSGGDDDDDDDDESAPEKGRRTRGKKLTYMLDDFESSDDGIKPGVKRPDTPPEERAAFIKRQEEIKRMLAEKNTEAAKALAAPKISAIPTPEKHRRAQAVDSLSTVPLQVIQTAKALDVDLKRSGKESDNDTEFDDDLPEDFDPEDMDEDEIAKMMEEEDFAQHQLKLAGEAIRNKKLKEADAMKKKESVKAGLEAVAMPSAAALIPQQASGPRAPMANAHAAGHGPPVHMMNIQQHGVRGSHGPGMMGPYGPLGPMGSRGPLGPHSHPGPHRPPGPPSLHNMPGQHGQQGPPGTHGPPGQQGPPGAHGPPGQQGPPGAHGPPGQHGQPGQHGPLGQRGAPNQHGSPGIHGPHGPLSQHSSPGSHLQVGQHGPTGPHGPLGQHGPPGQLSSPGSHHPAHLSGPHGPQGMRGPASSPGPQGMYGPHGSHGPPGAHGPQGSHGLPPGQGPHGPPGPMGPYGQRGGPHMMYGGPRGPHGPSGLIVNHGPHGQQSPHGPQGPHGPPGTHAPHGQHGLQGPHMGPHSSQMPFSMHGVPHGMHPRYGGRGMPMDPHHPMNASGHPPQTVMDYPPDAKMMKLTKLGAEPKKRGRKSKAELQAIEQSKGHIVGGPGIGPNVSGPGIRPSGPHMSQSLHGSSLIATQSSLIGGPQEPIIPTTVLSVQNTRLMDPSELGPPGAGSVDTSPAKKRGRRKKFTPLRETLRAAGGDLPGAANPQPGIDTKTNPILSERLTASETRNSLSIATPPQLFSPGAAPQPSVITRMPRPPLGSPYGPGGPPPQRYYPPAQTHPPGSISPNPRLTYPNMPPHGPPPLTSGPPPSSSSPSASTAPPPSGTFSTPEHGNPAGPAATAVAVARLPSPHAGPYRQPGPHYTGSGGAPVSYPPGPPPPMHRGGLQPIDAPPNSSPQEYQSVPPYASPFGGYYPPSQPAVPPAHPPTTVTSSAPPPAQTPPVIVASTPTVTATVAAAAGTQPDKHRPSAVGSFEQFDNAKHTPPHDRTTPNTYQQSPRAIDDESSIGAGSNAAAGGASNSGATAMDTTTGGSSEFSGLVSYFSSQQDDLEA